MLNINEYEHMSIEDCWNMYGWGTESKPGTEILHRTIGDVDVFVNETYINYGPNDDDVFACEIEADGELWGQGFGNSYESAIRAALDDADGHVSEDGVING